MLRVMVRARGHREPITDVIFGIAMGMTLDFEHLSHLDLAQLSTQPKSLKMRIY